MQTPNPQNLDFSQTRYSQTVTLTGATDQLVGQFSNAEAFDSIFFQIQNQSGAPLTNLKVQIRRDSDFQWVTLLNGASGDFASATNPLLRKFNSVDPTTLAVGASSANSIMTVGAKQIQILATGTNGTVLLVGAKGVGNGLQR